MGQKKDGSWEFKIDEEFAKEKEKQGAPQSSTVQHLRQHFKGHSPKMELDFAGVPGKRSRSHLAEQMEKGDADPFPPPSPGVRIGAGFIDLAFAGACLLVASQAFAHLQGPVTDYANELALKYTDSSFSSRQVADYGHPALKLACFLALYIWPLLFFCNSLGKRLTGIEILHSDGETIPGHFQVLARELVFKPLSLISVVGLVPIVWRADGRAVHDLIGKTMLYH